MLEHGINFRSAESQKEYFAAYEKTMKLFQVKIQEEYVDTEFGKTYVIKAGDASKPPLVLLHAASCGSPIWYKNFDELSKHFSLYAIDLIGETSKSLMQKKMKNASDNANWIEQTLDGLGLDKVSFPRWLKERQLRGIDMPVLVLLGENEFAFHVYKAVRRARRCIANLEIEIIKDASHLIPVSKPEYVNRKIMEFVNARMR